LDQEDGYCHSKNHQSNDGQDREQKRTSNDKDENSNTGEFLIGLWKELIGVENIKIDDDFFELGGDSLTALHLFVQIERRLNIRLPLATLYEAPTIEKLTTILNDKRYSARWDSLVAIQPEGSRPPLFFIHSEGGNVLEYNDLSQYLGSDQPFYALQAKGLEQGFSVHKTIEEMASSYLEEIRKVQSEGPYLLGGYCLGGLIAYQVAQQLIADGEKISLLFLVSTYNPQTEKRAVNAIGPLQTAYYRVVQRCGLEWSNLSFLSKKAKADYLWSRFHKVVNVVQVQAEKIINSLLLKIGREKTSHSLAFKLKMFADAQNRAFFNYVPQEISCNVRVFRAIRQSSFLFPDENLGWTKLLVNDLQRIDIDAYHKNILKKPNVKQLAEELTKCINSIL
jgi:thioesterase domain-containing protein/acyl carrier protein